MASSLCKNPAIKRALFSTLSSPTFPTFRSAKSAILSEQDPQKLAELFTHQSSNFARVRRHRPLFQLSVRKLSRSNRPDLVRQVLDHQKNESLSNLSSEGFWVRLIMLYSRSGMVEDAVRTFHQIKDSPCHQTEKSLCAMLTAFLTNGMFDKVHEFIKDIPGKMNVAPGVKSLNLVLKAFCEQSRGMEEARGWVNKMRTEYNVDPDISSYTLLLGLCLNNKDGNVFDEIVKEISQKALVYNATTYNYRIVRFCKEKEGARANKLLEEMVSKQVKPNSASYDTIIYGFCKVGDFESAHKVLGRMLTDGYVSPSSNTYYTLIKHMVKEGEFDSALEMCKDIIKRKWVPPFEPMKGLIEGLVKISKTEEAKDVVERMKRRLKGPAVDAWGRMEAALPL